MSDENERDSTLPSPNSGADAGKVSGRIGQSLEILGLSPEGLTAKAVRSAWKRKLVENRDEIGRADDHDLVADINSARDTLLAWIGE